MAQILYELNKQHIPSITGNGVIRGRTDVLESGVANPCKRMRDKIKP